MEKVNPKLEYPDPTPLEVPVGFRRPPSLREQMEAMFRQIAREKEDIGVEDLDEANDFDIPDDDPSEMETNYTIMAREVENGTAVETADDVDGDSPGPSGSVQRRGGSSGSVPEVDSEDESGSDSDDVVNERGRNSQPSGSERSSDGEVSTDGAKRGRTGTRGKEAAPLAKPSGKAPVRR